MCGIAGIIGLVGPGHRAALKRMANAMAHRGPDGEGFWEVTADAGGWGPMLAHRRLSILDLSDAAAQPMVDPVHGDVLVLNGEIYNYVELRNRLVADGHRFDSTGDTAAMLRTLAVHGEQAVTRLRGMFAFACWQAEQRKLLLARDALGIKPLYLLRNPDPSGDWSLAFASEVRALLASGLLARPRLDPKAAAAVVWNGFTVAPDTVVDGIQSVLPGELHVFDARGVEQRRTRFWSMPRPAATAAVCDERELDAALEESVRLHLASDVPLGVFLSGGVDSSSVANLAQRTSRAPVHTFTLGFDGVASEGAKARRVAQAIGTQHQELVLTEQRFIAQLDAALDSLDQPTFDGLNSYYMSHAVREAGFKVALVGSGGDELFGGYTSFRDLPRLMAWSRRAQVLPMRWRVALADAVSAAMQRPGAKMPRQTRWAKLPQLVRRGEDVLALYQMAYALFLPSFQQQLLGEAARGALCDGLPAVVRERLRGEIGERGALEAISTLEHRLFLGERLLRDTDAASMAVSIEVRLPLVDQVLLECVNRMPAQQRFQPLRTKAALRRSGLRGLDPGLFQQSKAGFELPLEHWLRSSLGHRIDGTMRDTHSVAAAGLDPPTVRRLWQAFRDRAPGLYWTRVWALYVHIRWCQRHGVAV